MFSSLAALRKHRHAVASYETLTPTRLTAQVTALTAPPKAAPVEDPLLVHARHEMIVAACVWFVSMIYSLGVCYIWGYGRQAATLTFVLGFPDWIFWGVVFPWGLCTLFSIAFALFYMRDDELEEALHVDDVRHAHLEHAAEGSQP